VATGHGALKSAKVSDFQGDVTLSKSGAAPKPVSLNAAVTSSDVVQTGNKSLAELEFNDKTLTRLGANTVFSFSPANREFEVQSGTALLQVPPGLGGAKIQTAAVTAAITGTTVMVQKLPSGVIKLLVLEGSMNATLKGSNQMRTIKAGQMLVIPPNVKTLPQPIVVSISTIMGTSNLVRNFRKQLASEEKISQTVENQEELTGNGGMKSAGIVITTPEDLINLVGNQTLTSATFDALTQNPAFVEESGGDVPNPPPPPTPPPTPPSNGGVTIGSGAVLTPTLNGNLGKITLAVGAVVSAIAGSDPNDTVFSIHGPVIFNGTLPTLSQNSPGSLLVNVVATDLSPTQTALRFANVAQSSGGNKFAGHTLFTVASGKIVFDQSQLDLTNTYALASTGNVAVQNGTRLIVNGGGGQLYGSNFVSIDDSTIDVIDTTGSSAFSVYSTGGLRVSNSTVGGDTGVGNTVSLQANGTISLSGSVIGGAGVANVLAYAYGNNNLSIVNSQITGSTVLLGGKTLLIRGTVINSPSITFYTNQFRDGGGNSFSTKPIIQPYQP